MPNDIELKSQTTDAASEPGATVLMVAASGPRREELTKWLADDGHRVLSPPNLAEALTRIENGDLLLIYAKTLGDDDLRLLETMSDSDGAWHVPVILVVDEGEEAALAQRLELGAADVMVWPVSRPRLLARVRASRLRKALRAQERLDMRLTLKAKQEAELLVSSLIPLGISMLGDKDPLRILELILTEGMRIADSEGGTIYMRGPDDALHFVLVRNDMLDINMGGSTGKPITFPPLRLVDEKGKPTGQYVVGHAVMSGQTVNVQDAYEIGRWDFSGTRRFDASTGYRSKSFLTVPLKNERQQIIGALQLINARDPRTGMITAFDSAVQPTIEAFALLAAAVLDAYRTDYFAKAKA